MLAVLFFLLSFFSFYTITRVGHSALEAECGRYTSIPVLHMASSPRHGTLLRNKAALRSVPGLRLAEVSYHCVWFSLSYFFSFLFEWINIPCYCSARSEPAQGDEQAKVESGGPASELRLVYR